MFGIKFWPYIAVGLLAFGLGGVAVEAYHQRFADPALEARVSDRVTQQVTSEQQLACLNATAVAAAAAQEAERLRQHRAGERALDVFRDESIAHDAARVSEIEKLEQENARYAQKLAAEGRSCLLTRDDDYWLRNGAILTPDQ